jgi:hypothetical protein
MSTERIRLVPALAGFVGGLVAATALALVAWNAGNGSVAKGIVVGASLTLVCAVVLWVVGPRAGLAGRLANAKADERDDRIMTRALADAALAMGVAACAGVVWAMYGAEAIAIAGVVLWSGLVTLLISATVRSRSS